LLFFKEILNIDAHFVSDHPSPFYPNPPLHFRRSPMGSHPVSLIFSYSYSIETDLLMLAICSFYVDERLHYLNCSLIASVNDMIGGFEVSQALVLIRWSRRTPIRLANSALSSSTSF
jgi:hypothetical protein